LLCSPREIGPRKMLRSVRDTSCNERRKCPQHSEARLWHSTLCEVRVTQRFIYISPTLLSGFHLATDLCQFTSETEEKNQPHRAAIRMQKHASQSPNVKRLVFFDIRIVNTIIDGQKTLSRTPVFPFSGR
jgi:hypothetical protein